MPELPEVETVRRGLAPVMEGARFDKVLAHRGDLRWPLPKDFAKRIEGTTVTGMGRRAKYLLADLSSGDVLVMHLGMSGSFHIVLDNAKGTLGKFHHERGKLAAHDHVVFHMRPSGAVVSFDPRHRLDEAGGATRAWRGAAAARTRAGAARQRIRRRDAGASMRGQEDEFEGRAARSDRGGRAGNIYVCEALNLSRLSPRRVASTLSTRFGAPHERTALLVDLIQVGAQRRDQGWWLIAARSSPDVGRARLLPAQLPGL